jgi:hypothetical protein
VVSPLEKQDFYFVYRDSTLEKKNDCCRKFLLSEMSAVMLCGLLSSWAVLPCTLHVLRLTRGLQLFLPHMAACVGDGLCNRCLPHQLFLTPFLSMGSRPESPVVAHAQSSASSSATARPRRPPAAWMGKLAALKREAVGVD